MKCRIRVTSRADGTCQRVNDTVQVQRFTSSARSQGILEVLGVVVPSVFFVEALALKLCFRSKFYPKCVVHSNRGGGANLRSFCGRPRPALHSVRVGGAGMYFARQV